MQSDNIYKQNLNGISVWALAFGCVIGWGSFVMPGTKFLPDSGPLGTTIGIIISALIVLFACANYSYLMSRNPKPGGSYTFTRGILGEDHAFLAAWLLEIAYISLLWANATAVILLFRYIFGNALQWGFLYRFVGYDVYLGEVFITILILFVFGLIDCFWKKITNIIRVLFGIIMFASVVVLFDFTSHLKACIKSMSSNALIPFEQEINNVKVYAALEKMRMGDRLTMEYDLQKTDFNVLQLGIQLLVFNAIRHGVFFQGNTGGKVTKKAMRLTA